MLSDPDHPSVATKDEVEEKDEDEAAANFARLYAYVQDSCDTEETFHFHGFEFLQRMNIVSLQNDLVQMKSQVNEGHPVSPSDLCEALKVYFNAIQNYQFTHLHPALPASEVHTRYLRLTPHFPDLNKITDARRKPFDSHYYYVSNVSPPTDSIRTFLRSIRPVGLTYSAEERRTRALEYEQGRPAHGVSDFVDRLARFLVAFTRGSFLLVPMLVIVLDPWPRKSVITTCVAVVLFATALAFGVRATYVETMFSMATYAAVLVVFVGTNTNSG